MIKELTMTYSEKEEGKEDRIIQKIQPKKAVEITIYNPTQESIINAFKRLKKQIKEDLWVENDRRKI